MSGDALDLDLGAEDWRDRYETLHGFVVDGDTSSARDLVEAIEAAVRADERVRIITTAQVELDAARAEVAALRGLLSEATAHETEPCRLDHNGDCQEHGYHDGPCLIPRARAALTTGGDQ